MIIHLPRAIEILLGILAGVGAASLVWEVSDLVRGIRTRRRKR